MREIGKLAQFDSIEGVERTGKKRNREGKGEKDRRDRLGEQRGGRDGERRSQERKRDRLKERGGERDGERGSQEREREREREIERKRKTE